LCIFLREYEYQEEDRDYDEEDDMIMITMMMITIGTTKTVEQGCKKGEGERGRWRK
jgi:hypothetical protein